MKGVRFTKYVPGETCNIVLPALEFKDNHNSKSLALKEFGFVGV